MLQFRQTTRVKNRLPCCTGCWLARCCTCVARSPVLLHGMSWLTHSSGVTQKSLSAKTRRLATKSGLRLLLRSNGAMKRQPQMHHGMEQLEQVAKIGVPQLVQVEAIGERNNCSCGKCRGQ